MKSCNKWPRPAGAEANGGWTRRGALAGGLAAMIAAPLTGCGRAAGGTLYGTDTHPRDYPTVQAFRHFGDLLEQRSGGRLKLKLFPGGQLGAERDTLEITSFGGLDFNRVNLAPLNSIEPLTLVPSLPFLFEDEGHLRRSLDGAPGQAVLASLQRHDLIGLCFYDSGGRSFYNTKRPIQRPDDMRGLKIRVQNSDLYVSMIRSLGADATPMDLGEVYQGLVQGVVDGAENNWPSYQTGRHYEVAPHYSLTNHVMAPEVLLMSKTSWNDLAAPDREIVMESARESVPFMRGLWDARVAEARAALTADGVKINEVDREAFRTAMRPVWEAFVKTPEQRRVVDAVLALGGGNA
jgi:tripartite ATP-independent transporter DctP family solute receptor